VKVHFPWDRACRAFVDAVRQIGNYLDPRQYTVVSASARCLAKIPSGRNEDRIREFDGRFGSSFRSGK
jgi:hypothetical protein